MAVATVAGHDVEFINYEAEDSFFGKIVKDIPYSAIAAQIVATKPDIIAFSCVTDNYLYQLECARAVKALDRSILTIFGGIHPTAVPEKTLANDSVDAVAIGEGERSLVDVLAACRRRSSKFYLPTKPVPGIIFKKNGHVLGEVSEGATMELDELPFPDKKRFFKSTKIPENEYRLITSRGCPYRCSYCFNSHLFRLRGKVDIRKRSVENVIEELKWAKQEFDFKNITFVDDSFTTHKKWIIEFCKRYTEEIAIPFACLANPNYLNSEVVEALASAGCVNVQMGIQSLSEATCKEVLDRLSDNKKISAAIEALRGNNLMVQVDHMLGIPGDTVEFQEKSVLFYNDNRPSLISVLWLTYYPKTTIMDTAVEMGILDQSDVEKIESGEGLNDATYFLGGSMDNPRPFYPICFILNWLPLLPRWLVVLLIKSRLYRIFSIKSYYLSIALPRVLSSIFNIKDFRGRTHLLRFIGKIFKPNLFKKRA